MKKYEPIEIEINIVDVVDVITTSPVNTGSDTPFIDIDDSLLSYFRFPRHPEFGMPFLFIFMRENFD